jgi:prophage regulatory protein
MAHEIQAATILRRKQVEAATGYSRSTIYLRIAQGLFVKPVSIGARAVGFPAGEVEAINAARIAGKSEADIRVLVARLQAKRGAAQAGA